MSTQRNRGEWSEIYVACSLVAYGQLQIFGDGNFLVEGVSSISGEYQILRNGNEAIVKRPLSEERFYIAYFEEAAEIIRDAIMRGGTGAGAFSIDRLRDFESRTGLDQIRGGRSKKSDIRIHLIDRYSGQIEYRTFSVKSLMGASPTLFNVSHSSAITFQLIGPSYANLAFNINSLNTVKERIRRLSEIGFNFRLFEFSSEVFKSNLQMIDTNFPELYACSILAYYLGKSSILKEVIWSIENGSVRNVCEMCDPSSFAHMNLELKFGQFLYDITLGMNSATKWDGRWDVDGGYIIVGENGEIVAHPFLNEQNLRDFLLNSTKFDTPSTSRHDFGLLEYDDSGVPFIRLMAQIRFTI